MYYSLELSCSLRIITGFEPRPLSMDDWQERLLYRGKRADGKGAHAFELRRYGTKAET